ncbi:hypothetical protein D1007_00990 [Hordeum vulgare]|nr:hypothetical protein D1007_00990 [Hordeum vulgare]
MKYTIAEAPSCAPPHQPHPLSPLEASPPLLLEEEPLKAEATKPERPSAIIEAPPSLELRCSPNHRKRMRYPPASVCIVGTRWEALCAAGEPRWKNASALPRLAREVAGGSDRRAPLVDCVRRRAR